jgi:hypothetical protein
VLFIFLFPFLMANDFQAWACFGRSFAGLAPSPNPNLFRLLTDRISLLNRFFCGGSCNTFNSFLA